MILNFEKEKWPSDAFIRYHFENGDYVQISVYASDRYGFWVQFLTKINNKYEFSFSLGDSEKLNKYVSIVEDSVTLEGLYVCGETALKAIKCFIETGTMSDQVDWITEKEIPQGMHWLITEDFL